MFNYIEFVSHDKSLLIAPAGYGKTFTLAECLKYTPEGKKQLILTHTHAGIAAIKEKIKKQNISSEKFHVETITGFAQKYVLAFYCGNDIPDQENSKDYYPFIIKKATELLNTASILRVISETYYGLFVDEYQDCTKLQHQMILGLSKVLPVHILGDPLQGIMDFNNDLVSFNEDLNDFFKFPELDTPHRWYSEDNNRNLGDALKEIRSILSVEGEKRLDLTNYGNEVFHIVKGEENDIYNTESLYWKGLQKLILNPDSKKEYESLLIIVPEYYEKGVPKGDVTHRAKLKTRIDYSNKLILLEAIDDKRFYTVAKSIDDIIKSIHRIKKVNKRIIEDVLQPLFNKGSITDWFKNGQIINKQGDNRAKAIKLEEYFSKFKTEPSKQNFLNILLYLKGDLKFKYIRQDLLSSVLRAIQNSINEDISVYNSMIKYKNTIRRVGRKIYGKCIGTTLLTKGLEFETVAILDVHRFESPQHLYVAFTRASKKLILFTKQEVIRFN